MTAPTRSVASVGVGAGTVAGLIWGLAFLLPVLVRGWGPVAVTAGRYVVYGGLSAVLFAAGGAQLRALARTHWRVALAFAVAGNVGYYLLLVLGIALAGAPLTDIIIGCIPVAMAMVGNLVDPRYRWRTLVLPIVLTGAGLLWANVLEIRGAGLAGPVSTTQRATGIACAFAAVVAWTWYGLANARFLSRYPEASGSHWSTVVGLATGMVTLLALPAAALSGQLDRTATAGPATGVGGFILASVVLGVLVSWVATALWNVASARMSPTAAGMLINVETVAGYGYVYAVRGHSPPIGQVAGLLLVMIGVILVVRLPATNPPTKVARLVPSGRRRHRGLSAETDG